MKTLLLLMRNYLNEEVEKSIEAHNEKVAQTQRREALLIEYKEIIQTLRNWDTLVYGMLTVVGTITAAIVAYSTETKQDVEWGIIISLFLFWLFTYIWITKLAEIRIDVLIEIEQELEMFGQYARLRKIKQVKKFAIWVLLPYFGAFVIGPLLGYIISNPDQFREIFTNIFK